MGLYAFFLLCIMFLCGRYNVVPGVHIVPKKAGFALAIVFITAITSLRFNIGFDWSNYVRMIYPKVNLAALRRLEPLSRLIISTAGYLGSPLFMFTVFAIITYGCIGRVISKHSVSKYESIMLYFCIFWTSDLSLLRQAAAVAVAFYGFTYIEQKKPFRYLLVCIVAILFHKSAVVALLLYPLYYLKPILLPFVLAAAIAGVLLVLPPLLRVANFYYGYLGRDLAGGGQDKVFLSYPCFIRACHS